MQKTIKKYRYLICITMILGSCQSFAIDVLNLPPLENLIVDHTQTLTPSQIESLSSGANIIQEQTSAQIAALIIPDRNGNELYDIGLKVFRDTKLGDKTLNNGLLLIIAKDEKKLRLTVGYGLEGTIPDVVAREIVEKIRPFVDQGDIFTAIQTYYTLVFPYLQGTEKKSPNNAEGYQITIRDQIRGVLFFVLISSISEKKKQKQGNKKQIVSLTIIGLIIIAIISFALFSFGFVGAIIGYFIGWLSQNTPGGLGLSGLTNGRGGFGGGGWSGGGGFSGGGGGSSGGGGAGD